MCTTKYADDMPSEPPSEVGMLIWDRKPLRLVDIPGKTPWAQAADRSASDWVKPLSPNESTGLINPSPTSAHLSPQEDATFMAMEVIVLLSVCFHT